MLRARRQIPILYASADVGHVDSRQSAFQECLALDSGQLFDRFRDRSAHRAGVQYLAHLASEMDAAGVIVCGILPHILASRPSRDIELRQSAFLRQGVQKMPDAVGAHGVGFTLLVPEVEAFEYRRHAGPTSDEVPDVLVHHEDDNRYQRAMARIEET